MASASGNQLSVPGSGLQIVLIGDARVGKTSFVRVLEGEPFSKEYKPTKEVHTYMYSTEPAKLNVNSKKMTTIADFAPSSSEEARRVAYNVANVVLICFAMDSPDSFAHVRDKWACEVRAANKAVPIVLVALKMDLIHTSDDDQLHRNTEVINERSVKNLVNDIGARAFFSASATAAHQVKDVFRDITAIAERKATPKRSFTKLVGNHMAMRFQPDP